MIIVDAHQDLAWNILAFGRDYTRSVQETRALEQGSVTVEVTDDSIIGYPEYMQGNIALIFATLFAPPTRSIPDEWEKVSYASISEAKELYQAQLDIYKQMFNDHPDYFRSILNRRDLLSILNNRELEKHTNNNVQAVSCPVGIVLLMEGAECIDELPELEEWWDAGVRIIGPAWAGNRFCGGTDEPGPLTSDGFALLNAMAELGFILDLSHMDEKALLEALDFYPGRIIASHSNAQHLLPESESNRHLSDRAIEGIIERDGVIGIVPFNSFLKTGWKRGDRRDQVSILDVVSQIDYICQIAGDANHVGIGTDFDGGFGLQSIPMEMDSIADLQKLTPFLLEKGYPLDDIELIFSKNWIKLLKDVLPE
jgi:membrane dipeptidase